MEGVVQRRPVKPLKEKFREHWETRDQIFSPSGQRANHLGIAFTLGFTTVLAATIVFSLVPELEQWGFWDTDGFWIKVATIFCYFQVISNWYLTTDKKHSQATVETVRQPIRDVSMMNPLPPEWKRCPICQLDVPPRSHHCKVCNICVLKRDHHCFFTGACIGFTNQRRFIVFVFYAAIGTTLGVSLLVNYLTLINEPWTYKWYCYLPVVSFFVWLLGSMTFWSFLMLMELYAGCIVVFVSGAFFFWELVVTLSGQTSHEASKGVHRYNQGVIKNFLSVFGPYGLVHFILPLNLPMYGDGVDWFSSSDLNLKSW